MPERHGTPEQRDPQIVGDAALLSCKYHKLNEEALTR